MIGGSIASSPEDALDKLARHARAVLVLIAGLQIGIAVFLWLAGTALDHPAVIGQVIGGVIYALLAMWAHRSPMPAVLVGLGLYALSVAYTAVTTGIIIGGLWGALLKVIFVAMFLNGIATARQYEQTKKFLAQQRKG